MKKYFTDDTYNRIPCGLVAFRNNEKLEIVYANEHYYSNFANGNLNYLNVCEEDKNFGVGLEEKNSNVNAIEVNYKCNKGKGGLCRVRMSLSKFDDDIWLGTLYDETDKYETILQLEDYRRKYALAVCNSDNIIFEDDLVNGELILYIPSELDGNVNERRIKNEKGSVVSELVYPNDREFFADKLYNENEEILSARMKLSPEGNWTWHRIHRKFEHNSNGELIKVSGFIRNIEQEKLQEQEMQQKFEIDPIFKVYTRNAAVEKINNYLKENPKKRDYALIVLDVDDFKNVNDTYGHLYGDAVISMIAATLKDAAGEEAIVGRYGGDEFFALLKNHDAKKVGKTAKNILERIKDYHSNDTDTITCSMGVSLGSEFDKTPEYRDLFDMADKALYYVKKNGKNNWKIYTDKEMDSKSGNAIEYEKDSSLDAVGDDADKTRDMMKVFLEISSTSRDRDGAMFKIIHYIAERYRMEWLQIMHVNIKDDSITIKYEWCSDLSVKNNGGRKGYYVHSDILLFKSIFERQSAFVLSEQDLDGFSMKFRREFSKVENYAVLYNANITNDESFYMFVSTRFDGQDKWIEEEIQELNLATKLMTMYVSQADIETENERKLRNLIEYDKKTGLYTIGKFYEQIGLLRKLAMENGDDVAIIHSDFHNFIEVNEKFGDLVGDEIIINFAKIVRKNEESDKHIITHIDGTDCFISAFRDLDSNNQYLDIINDINDQFCKKMNEKYEGMNLIIKSGAYIIKRNEQVADGITRAIKAKKSVKNFDKSFCAFYEEK